MQEIGEADASGALAAIYGEVRDLWCTPYVSAVHRVMAAQPGLLAWSWQGVAPAFRDGRAQTAAWSIADGLDLPQLEPISGAALALWHVDANALTKINDVTTSFVRVAPVNMMFAALVMRLLAEARACAPAIEPPAWQHPRRIGELPDMIDMRTCPAPVRTCLQAFAADMLGAPFIPGLYRMIAHWPGLLAHLTSVLPPLLKLRAVQAAHDEIRARIDAAAATIEMPRDAAELTAARPSEEVIEAFRSIASTYRKTSPEMIIAGTLIARALPDNAEPAGKFTA